MNPIMPDLIRLLDIAEQLLEGIIYLKPEEWDSPEQEERFNNRVEEITAEIERIKHAGKIATPTADTQGN